MVFREDELVFQSQGKQAHHGAWMSKFSHSVSAPKRLLNPFFAFSIQSS
jgi:pyridoxine/pyridoxamine 5'-phosphate oxidase